MNISSSNYLARYGSIQIKLPKTHPSADTAQITAPTAQDTVSISTQSRKTTNVIKAMTLNMPTISNKENAFSFGGLKFTSRAWQGEQTAEEAASGWKYYTKPGRVTSEIDQNLAGERMTLGKQIETALKANGIELDKDDALRLSVDKGGKITVDSNGLSEKSRKNVKAIEQALNSVSGLAKNLYLNSAAGVVNKAEKTAQSNPTSGARPATMGNDNPLYAAAQRESVDEWLRSSFGYGIDDLAAEGFAEGKQPPGQYTQQFMDYRYYEMSFDDGNDLQFTIYNIIKNSEKSEAVEFTASFTYKNGSLSDTRVSNAEEETAGDSPDAFEQLKQALQSLNATIAVAEDGTISIAGDDDELLAKLIKKAKQDGTYEQLIRESKAQLAKHVSDNGGDMKDFAVSFAKEGKAGIISMSPTPDDSQGAKSDTKAQTANKNWTDSIREFITRQSKNPLYDLLSSKFDVKM